MWTYYAIHLYLVFRLDEAGWQAANSFTLIFAWGMMMMTMMVASPGEWEREIQLPLLTRRRRRLLLLLFLHSLFDLHTDRIGSEKDQVGEKKPELFLDIIMYMFWKDASFSASPIFFLSSSCYISLLKVWKEMQDFASFSLSLSLDFGDFIHKKSKELNST